MANNYTEFSFLLLCSQEEAQKVIARYDDNKDSFDMDSDEYFEQYSGILYDVVGGGVWVHDDEGEGNVEAAIVFCQTYLREVGKPNQGVIIEWATTCSKPRLNEFFGGAVLVTADEVNSISAENELRRLASESGVELI